MKISVTLPSWGWVQRLLEWWHPGLQARAATFGKARANRRWWHGAVDVTTEVEWRE